MVNAKEGNVKKWDGSVTRVGGQGDKQPNPRGGER